MALYCIVGTDLCLSAEAWAAWAQAVASVGAIYAAGRIATNQAQKQFHGARLLQQEQRQAEFRIVAEVASQIARNAARAIAHAQDQLRDINGLHRVSGGEYFDRSGLQLVADAIGAVPLHDLKSRKMVTSFMELGSSARQALRLCDEALAQYRDRPGYVNFDPFFQAMQQLKDSVARSSHDVAEECRAQGGVPADP